VPCDHRLILAALDPNTPETPCDAPRTNGANESVAEVEVVRRTRETCCDMGDGRVIDLQLKPCVPWDGASVSAPVLRCPAGHDRDLDGRMTTRSLKVRPEDDPALRELGRGPAEGYGRWRFERCRRYFETSPAPRKGQSENQGAEHCSYRRRPDYRPQARQLVLESFEDRCRSWPPMGHLRR